MKVLHELSSAQLQVTSQLRSLANNRSIIITKPDKGRVVVVMDRTDYLRKIYTIIDRGGGMNSEWGAHDVFFNFGEAETLFFVRFCWEKKVFSENFQMLRGLKPPPPPPAPPPLPPPMIIDDPCTFRAIDTDTTMKNTDSLNRILRDLKKEELISEGEYSLARPVGAMPARLFGLPKLHKKDIPLRSVMSAIETVATSNLQFNNNPRLGRATIMTEANQRASGPRRSSGIRNKSSGQRSNQPEDRSSNPLQIERRTKIPTSFSLP